MKNKILNILKYLLFFGAGILLLFLVSRGQDFKAIFTQIASAKILWLFFAFIVSFISNYVRAMRWNILIESVGYKTNANQTFFALSIGYFANLGVPRIGEITRCGVISKQNNIPINSLIGTVIIERLVDLISLFILLIIVFISQLNFVGEFINRVLIKPFIQRISGNSTTLIIAISIFFASLALIYIIFRLMLPKIKKLKFFYKLKRFYVELMQGLKAIKKLKNFKAFLFQSLLIWIFYSLGIYFCFLSLDVTKDLSIIDAVTVLAIGTFGFIAPVPGGIGAYHFFVILTLVQLFKIDDASATSFAYLAHTLQTVMVIILGVISMVLVFIYKKKGHYDKLRNHRVKATE